MNTPFHRTVWAVIGVLVCTGGAFAQLPPRDLTIEFRQTEEGREAGQTYSAGPADPARTWEPQMLQVRNGEKASLRVQDSIPMQWVQSVSTERSVGVGQGGVQGGSATVGVTQGLTWFDAGQSLTVQPKWPGGNRPARVEMEVTRSAAGDRVGADLPVQSRNTVSTTITAPLGEWVTVAASGAAQQSGSYSSNSRQQVRRLLQIRVLVP